MFLIGGVGLDACRRFLLLELLVEKLALEYSIRAETLGFHGACVLLIRLVIAVLDVLVGLQVGQLQLFVFALQTIDAFE